MQDHAHWTGQHGWAPRPFPAKSVTGSISCSFHARACITVTAMLSIKTVDGQFAGDLNVCDAAWQKDTLSHAEFFEAATGLGTRIFASAGWQNKKLAESRVCN